MSNLGHLVGEAFAKRLAEARMKAELTQEELAYRSSMHRSEVGSLETGKRLPRLDTIIKLAGGLGVAPCELLPDVRWDPPARDVGSFRGGTGT